MTPGQLSAPGSLIKWTTLTRGAQLLIIALLASLITLFSPEVSANANASQIPSGVSLLKVSAGEDFTLGLGSDGKIYSWGNNSFGQLGDGTTTTRSSPVSVSLSPSLSALTFSAISAGGAHSLALGSDGKIYSWGKNDKGQLGDGTNTNSALPVAVSNSPSLSALTFSAISAGGRHSMAIDSLGQIYGWGDNGNGRLGIGAIGGSTSFPVAVSLSPSVSGLTFSAIAAGGAHSLALDSNGNIFSWGANGSGRLGIGTTTDTASPVAVSLSPSLSALTFSAIAAGGMHSLALGNDGKLYSWGNNDSGRLGIGDFGDSTSFAVAVTISPNLSTLTFSAIAAGSDHSLALGSDGKIYSWGDNRSGQLGIGTTADTFSPVAVSLPPSLSSLTFSAVVGGLSHTVAIDAAGFLYVWGDNSGGELGLGYDPSVTSLSKPVRVHTPAVLGNMSYSVVTIGEAHSLALGSDGQIYSWGSNSNGQLGIGAIGGSSSFPVAVSLSPTLNSLTFSAISVGGAHSLAIGSDGKIYSWGVNGKGQLGDGTLNSRPSLVSLSGLLDGLTFSAIAAGFEHSIALDRLGQIYSWGENTSGQLGDGTTANKSSPVAVSLSPSLSSMTFSAIAAGRFHSMALGSDGKIYSWGENTSGRLGDGTTLDKSSPVAVTLSGLSVSTFSTIAAGDNHSMALGSDGKIYSWGDNDKGRLGVGIDVGSLSSASSPLAATLSGLSVSTFSAIAAGAANSMALGSDGKIYSWGFNGSGRLGIGSTDDTSSPVAVTLSGLSVSTFSTIALGSAHGMALGSDGKIYTWGDNGSGRLGLGPHNFLAPFRTGISAAVVIQSAGGPGSGGSGSGGSGSGGSGSSAPAAGVTPASSAGMPAFTGPVINEVSQRSVRIGDSITLFGERLSLVSSVEIDGVGISFSNLTSNSMVLIIPTGLTLGVKDIVFKSSSGTVTSIGIFTLVEVITSSPITPSSQKLNAGVFKNFVAVYARGYQSQELKVRVAGRWIDAGVVQSNFIRITRKTQAVNFPVLVVFSVDGVIVKQMSVTTK